MGIRRNDSTDKAGESKIYIYIYSIISGIQKSLESRIICEQMITTCDAGKTISRPSFVSDLSHFEIRKEKKHEAL